jgi:hypothetical protein
MNKNKERHASESHATITIVTSIGNYKRFFNAFKNEGQ